MAKEPCSPFPKVDFIQPVWSHGTDIDAVNILYPSKKKLDLIRMELCKRGPSLTAKFSFPYAVHRGSFGIDIMCFGKANKLACNSMTCIMKPLGLKKKKKTEGQLVPRGCKWGRPELLPVWFQVTEPLTGCKGTVHYGKVAFLRMAGSLRAKATFWVCTSRRTVPVWCFMPLITSVPGKQAVCRLEVRIRLFLIKMH